MQHTKQFIIKLVATIAFIWAIQYFFPKYIILSFSQIIVMSTVLSILGYYGDIMIMPQIGRLWAAVLDIPFTMLIIWLGSLFLAYRATLGGLFIVGLGIGIWEFIHHLLIVDTRKVE